MTRSASHLLPLPACLALLALPLHTFACENPDAPPVQVVSSLDLHPVSGRIQEITPPERVLLDEECAGKLSLGVPEFSQPNGCQTVHLPITNASGFPVKFVVSTSFFRTDGQVVPCPYPEQKGGFESISRGFVGLLSMGASEAALRRAVQDATIQTTHTLEPGESIIVEHQLPYPSDTVVGSRSQIALGQSPAEQRHESSVRRTLSDQYWKVRDQYFEDRRLENARWDALRGQLERAKSKLEPLSEAYQAAMASYWEAHRAHTARIHEIEVQFESFVASQADLLESELSRN